MRAWMPARCRKTRARLALAAGQDLSEAASRSVWAHLAGCVACRREYSGHLSARSALTTLAPRAGDEALCAGLQREILDRVDALEGERGRRFGTRASVAAAAALLVLGVVLVRAGGPRPPGLLERPALDSVATWPVDPAGGVERLTPLFYAQGLEARRQLDRLFEADDGAPATWVAPARRGR